MPSSSPKSRNYPVTLRVKDVTAACHIGRRAFRAVARAVTPPSTRRPRPATASARAATNRTAARSARVVRVATPTSTARRPQDIARAPTATSNTAVRRRAARARRVTRTKPPPPTESSRAEAATNVTARTAHRGSRGRPLAPLVTTAQSSRDFMACNDTPTARAATRGTTARRRRSARHVSAATRIARSTFPMLRLAPVVTCSAPRAESRC